MNPMYCDCATSKSDSMHDIPKLESNVYMWELVELCYDIEFDNIDMWWL